MSNKDTSELKKQIEKIDWGVAYGSVKIQVRQGKATLLTVEETVKID